MLRQQALLVPAFLIGGGSAREQLCLCVLTAAIPTPHAICRPVHLIMKVNLLNTSLILGIVERKSNQDAVDLGVSSPIWGFGGPPLGNLLKIDPYFLQHVAFWDIFVTVSKAIFQGTFGIQSISDLAPISCNLGHV